METTNLGPRPADRVPRVAWVGLVAIAFYLLIGAGLANLITALEGSVSMEADFALGHLVPLPISIIAGLAFARWAGWWDDIWSVPRLRRRWMLAVPVLLAALPLSQVGEIDWSERSVQLVLVIAAGCLLVGLGEELFVRGILRVSIRAHHGELFTLLATSMLFGAGHCFGLMIAGAAPGKIVFAVVFTAMSGSLYYAALRVSGTLWVPILLHALTDFMLYVESADPTPLVGHAQESPFNITTGIQALLVVLSVFVVISAAREEMHARRERRPKRSASNDPGSQVTLP